MPGTGLQPCDEGVILSSPVAAPCSASAAPWILTATILGSSLAFIDGSVVNLAPGAGPEFLGIYQGKPVGDIGHFCLGVQNFDADRVLAALEGRGVKASIRTRGQSREIFLTDPDNISVQLTDASYCGGSGPLGNQCK